MTKARIKIEVVIDYEMRPSNYPPNSTPKEMLDIDLAGANEDPFIMMDSDNVEWNISGEILKE